MAQKLFHPTCQPNSKKFFLKFCYVLRLLCIQIDIHFLENESKSVALSNAANGYKCARAWLQHSVNKSGRISEKEEKIGDKHSNNQHTNNRQIWSDWTFYRGKTSDILCFFLFKWRRNQHINLLTPANAHKCDQSVEGRRNSDPAVHKHSSRRNLSYRRFAADYDNR